MLNQKLQQKLLQKLSPQQIQLIKLLEVPTMQLEQRIKRELEDNPVLEEGREEETSETYESDDADDMGSDSENDENIGEKDDDFSLDDYMQDDDIPDYKLTVNNYSKDDKKAEIPFSGGSSFHETLKNQLGLHVLTPTQEILAEYIIGNIDEDGYLRRDLEAIVDDLLFSQNVKTTLRELEEVLEIIQGFDPPGVGARDLRECLLLQIRRRMIVGGDDPAALKVAEKLLKDNFNEFTKKHYKKIISRLNISELQMKDAVDEIIRLNPKPGSSYSESQEKSFHQIVPDFILENSDGRIQCYLNSKNAPDLRINRTYAGMLEDYHRNKKNYTRKDKEAIAFVKQKLDSAKWFIDAIKQRQNTLILTMNAIIEYQREYFYEGDETRLRPMILKDIAEKTGLDISTISRVANSKYIQTHFGIFPLKYFFSEGMQTDSGEEVSTREIKKILQDCISGESKRRPLTDDRLSRILQDKGYQIARRTVAKYREQLNIPVARLRKEL